MTGPALLGAVRDAVVAGDQAAACDAVRVYADWLEERGNTADAYLYRRRLAEGATVEVHEPGPMRRYRTILLRRPGTARRFCWVGEFRP